MYFRFVIAFFNHDCIDAEPHFRAALRVQPALTKMQALLAVCEKQLDEPSAQKDMEIAFDRVKDPKLRTQLGIELANLYYQQGDLDHTAVVLRTLLEINPNNVDVLFFAQRIYSELADQTLNKLALLAPGSARMEQLIAERLINAGDLKDATAHYRKALQLDPHLPGMHFELAEALMEASPNDSATQGEALDELNAAIKTDGDSAKIECELGRIAQLQSQPANALRHFQRAYKMDPNSSDAEIGMAAVLEFQGSYQQSAEYLRRVVASDPLNAQAHYRLSRIDRKLHLDDEAQRELKLFLDVRAAREKVKHLYREMSSRTAAQSDAPGSNP